MKLTFEVKDKNLIVNFHGELDHHTAEEIRKEIDGIYSMRMLNNIILDLQNLNFMDSSGIGLIMGRYKLVNENNGRIFLVNVGSRVEKILKMSGILKIVNIRSSIEDALNNH